MDRCQGRCGSLWVVPGFSNYGYYKGKGDLYKLKYISVLLRVQTEDLFPEILLSEVIHCSCVESMKFQG